MKVFIALFWGLSIMFPLDLRADNSFIASAYTQIKTGRWCGDTNEADLKAVGFRCEMRSQIPKLLPYDYEVFEYMLFSEAAKDQVQKNECLQAQIASLLTNKQKLNNWTALMAGAWLSARKAQLIEVGCYKKYDADIANTKKGFLLRPPRAPRPELTPEWNQLWPWLRDQSRALGIIATFGWV